MLDQLPRWGDVSVVVIERPPLMPRKGSHQMIAAWGRVYEWCRLALDPAEILTPMPRSWMGGESKAERGARIAA